MDMYAEVILDYYRHPRNSGVIDGAEVHAHDVNPLCGDVIDIYAKVDGKKISEVKFTGKGCAISQAAASMLTELVEGKNVEDVKNISKKDVFDLIGISLSPARIKCALLGLKVLKIGVYNFLGSKIPDKEKDDMEGM